MDGKVAAEDKIRELLANPEMMRAMNARRQEAQAAEAEKADDASTS
jgi:type VI secretion system protein ImpB